MLVANKLPMKYVETFYKGSNYLFFGWLFVGGTINWIITGNLSFIISYLFPYIAIPMLTASMMYIYKNFREMRKLRQTGSGAVNVNVQAHEEAERHRGLDELVAEGQKLGMY
jgi:hypothetical protein